MKKREKINTEQSNENEIVVPKVDISAHSPIYMIIFYSVSALVFLSMIFHFIILYGFMNYNSEISMEAVLTINENIPYDKLVFALVFYCLSMFGIDGTRSVIMALDVTTISEKAKNMPKYKRNRLIQMLITFMILSIMGLIFQMLCINCIKADFHLGPLFAGIAVFMSLLAYADFGPKLGKQIRDMVQNNKEKPKDEEHETK